MKNKFSNRHSVRRRTDSLALLEGRWVRKLALTVDKRDLLE